MPLNDAALDVEHWSGHTGCIILAPHLTSLTKHEVGLPRVGQATPRQQRDRMCWKDESERYNDGEAFKVTCRTEAGVMVTIIADNYFGYCKRGQDANQLRGEPHGRRRRGARRRGIVFPSWSVGEELQVNSRRYNGRTFEDVVPRLWELDRRQAARLRSEQEVSPDLVYIPEDARADLREQEIRWVRNGTA